MAAIRGQEQMNNTLATIGSFAIAGAADFIGSLGVLPYWLSFVIAATAMFYGGWRLHQWWTHE